MANLQNLLSGNPATQFKSGQQAVENGRKGGIRSGEVRRERAMMKQELEAMLKQTTDDNTTYKNKVTLGLLANAIDKTKGGSPEAYKTILAVLGELKEEQVNETPSLNINIVDNSNLEKTLYSEENNE